MRRKAGKATTVKSPLLQLALVATVFLSSGCSWFVADPSYTYDSPQIYDSAKLLRPYVNESELVDYFARLVRTECGEHRLVRVTVSPDRWGLKAIFNTFEPEAYSSQSVRDKSFHFYFGDPELAQLWCFNGQASVLIRSGGRTSLRPLVGGKDARRLTIKGVELTLVGFNLQPGAAHVSNSTAPRDSVWLYALVDKIPALQEAKSIHDALENELGMQVFLILRTDPVFVQYDGPAWDVFSERLPQGSATRFLDKSHIVCPPNVTGGECLSVTSPPMLPAEAWRSRHRD